MSLQQRYIVHLVRNKIETSGDKVCIFTHIFLKKIKIAVCSYPADNPLGVNS